MNRFAPYTRSFVRPSRVHSKPRPWRGHGRGFVPTLDREAEEAVRSIQDAQVMLSPDRRSTRRSWVAVTVYFNGSYQCSPAQLPSLGS